MRQVLLPPSQGGADIATEDEADGNTTVDPASVAAPIQPKKDSGKEEDYKDQSPVRKTAKEPALILPMYKAQGVAVVSPKKTWQTQP